MSSYAQVVHTTAKQVIPRRGNNENVFKMSKNDKCTSKACKNTVFHCQICKFVGFLLSSSSWLLKLPKVTCEKQFKSSSLFSPLWTKFITRQLKDFKPINPSLRKRGSDEEISMHLNTNRNKLKPKTFSMKKNVQIVFYGNNWMVEICLGASGLVSVDKISGNSLTWIKWVFDWSFELSSKETLLEWANILKTYVNICSAMIFLSAISVNENEAWYFRFHSFRSERSKALTWSSKWVILAGFTFDLRLWNMEVK